MGRTGVAILGSGNIGSDLMIKILERSSTLELKMLVGVDPASDGLARARQRGVLTTHEGVQGLWNSPEYASIDVVFDATSAYAHEAHAERFERDGKTLVDMTPAARGPFVVPVANLEAHLGAPNVNMVTCGGQATIPIVWAVGQCAPVRYAEIVASIASKSAGPGTRANIDEFTQTTARAIEQVGGAKQGKAIIILNPAEPPLMMRDTVYTLVEDCDPEDVRRRIEDVVKEVATYVPGYRLAREVVFDDLRTKPLILDTGESFHGWKVTTFLEVEGAGDYLPRYAGNLDIMTSAALRVGELIAERRRAT